VVSGAVAGHRDVTQLDEAERALREADRRKDQFLAMLSHELRNPLAPIRNSIYILDRASPGGEQARRAHAVIERQVHHLTRLVDDLLDITRITRGKVRLLRERVELTGLVRRTAEDHRTIFAHAGVALETSVPRDPLHVIGDPTRLVQVIGNLLHNAAKFTPRGGRTTLSVRAAGNALAEIRVGDSGAGLTPQTLSTVFEPFVQADQTLARSQGGLGLGLALVKGIVELHGGSVTAHSEGPGRGAEFVVALPVDRAEAARPAPAVTTASPAIARRVLVVEDDPDAAETLKVALELNEHVVAVASGGAEAVDAARRFQPDVVLCDIGLPGMDGYEVARTMRSDAALGSTHLVALSGYASPDDVERARNAGFERHIAKPPSFDELEGALRDVMASSNAPVQASGPATTGPPHDPHSSASPPLGR
jgi:CheY-like chemotaxis protein/nitrogen-specific signal transduction histidine kinase